MAIFRSENPRLDFAKSEIEINVLVKRLATQELSRINLILIKIE